MCVLKAEYALLKGKPTDSEQLHMKTPKLSLPGRLFNCFFSFFSMKNERKERWKEEGKEGGEEEGKEGGEEGRERKEGYYLLFVAK